MPTPIYPIDINPRPYQSQVPQIQQGGQGNLFGYLMQKRALQAQQQSQGAVYNQDKEMAEIQKRHAIELADHAKKNQIEVEKAFNDIATGKANTDAHLAILNKFGVDPTAPPEVQQQALATIHATTQSQLDQNFRNLGIQNTAMNSPQGQANLTNSSLASLNDSAEAQAKRNAISIPQGESSYVQGADPKLLMGQTPFNQSNESFVNGMPVSKTTSSGANPAVAMALKGSNSIQDDYNAAKAGQFGKSPVSVAPMDGQDIASILSANLPSRNNPVPGNSPINLTPQPQQSPNGIIPQVVNGMGYNYQKYVGQPFAQGAQSLYDLLWRGQQQQNQQPVSVNPAQQ